MRLPPRPRKARGGNGQCRTIGIAVIGEHVDRDRALLGRRCHIVDGDRFGIYLLHVGHVDREAAGDRERERLYDFPTQRIGSEEIDIARIAQRVERRVDGGLSTSQRSRADGQDGLRLIAIVYYCLGRARRIRKRREIERAVVDGKRNCPETAVDIVEAHRSERYRLLLNTEDRTRKRPQRPP